MAAPNIVGVTTIFGSTDVLDVTDTATAITTNAADSGKVYKINSLIVSNSSGVTDGALNVDLYRGVTAYHLAKAIVVPGGSTLLVVTKDIGVYLAEGDSIRCTADSVGVLQAVCSYEEIS